MLKSQNAAESKIKPMHAMQNSTEEKKAYLKTHYGTLDINRLVALRAVYKHVKLPPCSTLIVAAGGTLPLALLLSAHLSGASVTSAERGAPICDGGDAVMLYSIYVACGCPFVLMLGWDTYFKGVSGLVNSALIALDCMTLGVKSPPLVFATARQHLRLWPAGHAFDLGALAARATLAAPLPEPVGGLQKSCQVTVLMRASDIGNNPRRDLGAFMLLAERLSNIKFVWATDEVAARSWKNIIFCSQAAVPEILVGACYVLARTTDVLPALALLLRGLRIIFVEDFAVPVRELWSPSGGGLLCTALGHRKFQHLKPNDLLPYLSSAADVAAATVYVQQWSDRCDLAQLGPPLSQQPTDGGA